MASELGEVKTAIAAGGGFGGAFFALRWIIIWFTGRVDRRQAQLDAEHATLDMGWREYRLHLEQRIASIERQNNALRVAFQHVSLALIRLDPQNEALLRAERLMAEAFPSDFSLAAAMAEGALDMRGTTT